MEQIHFKPSGYLTFDSVVKVRDSLCTYLKDHTSAEFFLDLAAITHCDSAGLALLIEAKKLCVQHSKIFNVIGVSAKIHDLAEFCGVNDILVTHHT